MDKYEGKLGSAKPTNARHLMESQEHIMCAPLRAVRGKVLNILEAKKLNLDFPKTQLFQKMI